MNRLRLGWDLHLVGLLKHTLREDAMIGQRWRLEQCAVQEL